MLVALRQLVAKKILKLLQLRAEANLKRSAPSLHGAILTYTQQTRSTGCQWTDYWELYRQVRRYRPREVLELGTGVSTLVIAHALQENGAGRVTSMEEADGWFAMAKELLPERYKQTVDLRFSETIADGHAMFRGVRYKDAPERLYDFVFVDGPDFGGTLSQRETFDMDLIHVLKRSERPIRAIIDSRTNTFWTLATILGATNVRFNYLTRIGIVLPCTRANVRDTRKIAHDAFGARSYRRPPFFERWH